MLRWRSIRANSRVKPPRRHHLEAVIDVAAVAVEPDRDAAAHLRGQLARMHPHCLSV